MKHYLNVCDVNGAEVEPVDVITFGSPCQDLSVAGKRAGLKHESNGDDETTRSGLFMEAVRIIKEMRKKDGLEQLRSGRTDEHIRPRFAVWENVPGAFSSNKGEDFRVVLEELARIKDAEVSIPLPEKGKWKQSGEIVGDGWSIAWRTLDAQYHGVPQRRRRIFLVADFADECAGEILFECKGLPGYPSESSEKGQGIAGDFAEGIRGTGERECVGFDGYNQVVTGDVSKAITSAATDADHVPLVFEKNETVPYTLKIRSGCEGGGKGALIQTDKSATLAVAQDQTLFQPVMCLQGSMIGRKDENGPQGDGINVDKSFTLNTIDRHAVAYGICSYASNSMKSDNPHSGIYEATTSRTLDLNGGNPACNQGGICICEAVPMKSGVIDVETEVYVRKYEVDCKSLCDCLRNHKFASGFSNKEIADQLNIPLTKVEHWFRQDASFAIPDAEIWMDLKKLLGIEKDEFDESITTYVAQEGKYDMSNRIYVGDIAPTLTTQSAEYKYLLPAQEPLLFENHSQDTRYRGPLKVAPTVSATYGMGGNNQPFVVVPKGYAMQAIGEYKDCDCASALKSRDYKDATDLVCEPVYGVDCRNGVLNDELYPTLQAKENGGQSLNYMGALLQKFIKYIVRRLTPTECARLQGMPDLWCRLSQIDDMSDEDYEFWKQAHKTYAEINGKTYKEKTKLQMIKWYNGLQADSSEYKAYGNGMALPCVRVPIHGIAKHGAKTMASLFDGIGGFPLAGLIDGIQTLWTSEIELFPIAVTMERFREFEKYGCFTFGYEGSNANLSIEKEKEMELKVKAPTFPEVIEFNFDELKQEITERASTYVNLVYSEEQIQDAKKDRATLNKFVKALSDERIKIKKECLKPYEDFEAKIKELDKIVSVAISNIDSQVKGYEEKKKQEKLDEITNFFNSTDHPEWLHISQIMNDKWLNASVSMKAVMGEMDSRLEQIESDLATLANLPEFGFEATEVYKRTLDLATAISEGQKLADMAKRKAETEAQKVEVVEPVKEAFQADAMNPPEQPKQWVSFKALLTVDQAKELKRFFDDRCIEFEAV